MRITRKLKVLVVDDSILFREVLAQGLLNDPGIDVVGKAKDAYQARDLIEELEPDIITLDVEMPKMNGIEFLKKLMSQYPLPVVVVSAVNSSVFEALDAGAVDFVKKPDNKNQNSMSTFINELILKVKIASTAKVGHLKKDFMENNTILREGRMLKEFIIAIGASTGGTEALFKVIKAFPRDMPGVVIVQHMPPVFTKMYAERLNNSCNMEVKEAENGDLVIPGRVLIAPGDFQMEVVRDREGYFVKCYKGNKVSGHCPSVDVLFNSVAKHAKKDALGVILTGMGSDGAKGLLEMKKSGAYTIGQDEKSSVVYGMPMVAYNIGAVLKQASLERIPYEIFQRLKK